jgi:death on curing protein
VPESRNPRWINQRALLLLHSETLTEHGGLAGIRDRGLLESAMARPRNLHAYEPESDLARLAAAYGFGLARNHPFNDGNKRAAFLAIGLFLRINGWELIADPAESIAVIISLAEGSLSEPKLADWIRRNSS